MIDVDQFIEDVYPQHDVLQRRLQNSDFFTERAILCSKNVNVDAINRKVTESVVGGKVTLYFADTVQSDLTNTEQTYPSEYIQTLSPSELPPAVLELKQIGQYVLKVKVLVGGSDDAVELISRLTVSTLSGTLPFILTRKQYSVRVFFLMTINKLQEQCLKEVAVDLRRPVLTYGQLYVALSRATSANGVAILLSENVTQTENVVYPEVSEKYIAEQLETRLELLTMKKKSRT